MASIRPTGNGEAGSAGDLIAASSKDQKGRSVLMGDGSVQHFEEDEFWDRFLRGRPEVRRAWGRSLLGPEVPANEVESLLKQGVTLVSKAGDQIQVRSTQLDLGSAVQEIQKGRLREAVRQIHMSLREGGWDPDEEFVFQLPPVAKQTDRRDVYSGGDFRQGGWLALLAVLAARAGDADALSWALGHGAAWWKERSELDLFKRQIHVLPDRQGTPQDTEWVRMKSEDVLALQPGSPTPMTLTRTFGGSDRPPQVTPITWPWREIP